MNSHAGKFNLAAAFLIVLTGTLLIPQRTQQTTLVLAATSTSTEFSTALATNSAASAEITLIGQLLPAVYTGPNAGVGSYGGSGPDPLLQPIEYYLYDSKNNYIKLAFDKESFYQSAWQTWLSAQPDKNRIAASATQAPANWVYQPKHLLYSELWQDWAGKWISITGTLMPTDTIHVDTFQTANMVTATFAEQLSALSLSLSVQVSTSTQHVQQVIFVGCIKITDGNPPPRPTYQGSVGPLTYYMIDSHGQQRTLLVYDSGQPNNETRMTLIDGSLVRAFEYMHDKCARFTGWVFNPPRWADKPDLIEVQLIQEVSHISLPNS